MKKFLILLIIIICKTVYSQNNNTKINYLYITKLDARYNDINYSRVPNYSYETDTSIVEAYLTGTNFKTKFYCVHTFSILDGKITIKDYVTGYLNNQNKFVPCYYDATRIREETESGTMFYWSSSIFYAK